MPTQGLCFLHKRNIFHGDLKLENTLVNHFGRQGSDYTNQYRKALRLEGKLTYAIFDFNLAIMFPKTSTAKECRLSYHRTWKTYESQRPSDTLQGEIDFDPFAFDVGILGVLFCHEFQQLTPDVPMLAPLFDMMVTRDIPRRFTASEALSFFEEKVVPRTSEGKLKLTPFRRGPHRFQKYDRYDRWKDLDGMEIFL
ncbi:hypothetical protein H0H92_002482 [Tricholoma furcatifolium]|nr:hypothetical protein H0H92_002482 [Tricholoma furcatifolium]